MNLFLLLNKKEYFFLKNVKLLAGPIDFHNMEGKKTLDGHQWGP